MKSKVKRALSFFVFLSVFSATGFSISAAQAQEIDKLTKDNVTEFIETTTHITSGRDYEEMSSEEILDYLKNHVHDDARFISTMRFTFPGMPPQETKLSIKKKEFMESIEKGEKALSDYESEIEIKDIKISSDKKKATVKTVGMEMGDIPTKLDSGEIQKIPMQGVSECTQILMLNKKGVIQMYNADCVTTIDLLSY